MLKVRSSLSSDQLTIERDSGEILRRDSHRKLAYLGYLLSHVRCVHRSLEVFRGPVVLQGKLKQEAEKNYDVESFVTLAAFEI